jgi:hypothetical protein
MKEAKWELWQTPNDWPEIVKVVATAGQHVLAVGTADERSHPHDIYVYMHVHTS